MGNYKLIALDMDGTLLNSKKQIEMDSLNDINNAVSNGKIVVLCTGRGKMEIKEYRDQLSMVRYAILLSGALIYDMKLNEAQYQKHLPEHCIERIIKVAEKYDGMLHYMNTEKSVVRKDQVNNMAAYQMAVYQEMFKRVADPVDDIRKSIEENDLPLKMLIYFRSAADRKNGLDELKELPLEFVFAENTSLEMTAKGVDKGDGLKRLAGYLNIPMNEAVAIGDAPNDTQMLKAAGYAIAMKNASDDIKAICDYETEDNDHNGVGKAIRNILMN